MPSSQVALANGKQLQTCYNARRHIPETYQSSKHLPQEYLREPPGSL